MVFASVGKIALLAALASGQSPARKAIPKPQHNFTAEDEGVHHPVFIPDSVFIVLAQDERSKIFLDDGETRQKPLREWYSAEKLYSPSASEQLYMVMAAGPLVGGNIATFWLVRDDIETQHAEVLWTFGAHDVIVSYPHGSSYPVIRTHGMTAIHIWNFTFRYRNGKYVQTHTDDEDL